MSDRILPGSQFRRRDRLVVYGGAALVSAVAAYSVTHAHGNHVAKPLLLMLVLAGGAILFCFAADQLFLGWLFVAPFFQESSGSSRFGHLLALGLYTAPPLVFAWKMAFARGRRPRAEWFDYLPALYVGCVVVSLALTSHQFTSHPVSTFRAMYQYVALGPLVYYVVAFWKEPPLSAVRIGRIVLWGSIIQAVMSIVERLTSWNVWGDHSWHNDEGFRTVGTLVNPGSLGAFIGIGMVLALAVLFWDGPRELRRLSIVILVLGPPGVLVTVTRGDILATLLVCLVVLLLSPRSRLFGIGAIALTALTLVALWPTITSLPVYQHRFARANTVDTRIVLQDVSLKLAKRKPILGWGYGSFDRVKFDVPPPTNVTGVTVQEALQSTSHDTFLTVLVETGIVGLALLLIPWGVVCLRGVRRARLPGPERWICVAGVGAVFVYGITAVTLDFRFFSFPLMLPWLFLGLVRRVTASPEPAA